MQNYEFLGYVPTPGEKHLGIATIKLWGRLILRFKIIPSKDGTTFFPGCASYKMPDLTGSGDYYAEAFMLDSRSEHQNVMDFIKAHVKKEMGQEQSVFGAQTQNEVASSQGHPQVQKTQPQQSKQQNSGYWESMPEMPQSKKNENFPF